MEKNAKNKKILDIISKLKEFGTFNWIILLIYICAIIFISIYHEYSLDESQSILLTRDLNFIDMIKQLKYEGHSFLWYSFLYPFVKLGFIQIHKVIPIIACTIAAVIILKKSPFNIVLKLLLVFSSGMMYWYSAFSRPYCLIPLLLALLADIDSDKKNHPYKYAILLGLLANTHLVMLPVSVVLAISFWGKELFLNRKSVTVHEKKILIKSLLILVILMSFVLVFAILGYFYCSLVNQNFNKTDIARLVDMYGQFSFQTLKGYGKEFIDVFERMTRFLYTSYSVPTWYYILIIITFLLCFINFKSSFRLWFTFICFCIFSVIIYVVFQWWILPIRINIIVYIMMFWVWILKKSPEKYKHTYSNKITEIALVLWIFITSSETYLCIYDDFTHYFTGGKMVSDYVKNFIPKKSNLIYIVNDAQQTFCVYLNKDDYPLYLNIEHKFTTFNTWASGYGYSNSISKKDIIDTVSKFKKKNKKVYVISSINDFGHYMYYEDLSLRFDVKILYATPLNKIMTRTMDNDGWRYFVVFEIS